MKENVKLVTDGLFTFPIICKLGQMGQYKNITEEIIFYIEARVLKHQKGME